jgi:hypothetical protein
LVGSAIIVVVTTPSSGLVMDQNLLFYGDNLDVLRRYIRDETDDLV